MLMLTPHLPASTFPLYRCTSRILLSVSLPFFEDFISTGSSSLVIVIFLQHGKSNLQWQELGQTRVTAGQESGKNLNPRRYALGKVPVIFHFESVQTLKFDVYTVAEEEGARFDAFKGSMICLLSDICRAPGRSLTRPILQQQILQPTMPPFAMLLTVSGEEQMHQNSFLRIKLKVREEGRKEWRGEERVSMARWRPLSYWKEKKREKREKGEKEKEQSQN